MEQIGKIIKTQENMALVNVVRAGACGENCKSCSGCSLSNQTVWVKNSINAPIDAHVCISMSDSKVLFAAILVYIIPIILMIAGYILFNGYVATICFLIPFVTILLINKKISNKFTSYIIKVID